MKKLLRKLPGYQMLIRPLIRRGYWKVTSEDHARVRFYAQHVASGDLVFDVGANMGNRSKAFLLLGARVVAFEPQSDCIRYLLAAAGDHPDFTLVEKALGSQQGEAKMLLGSSNVLSTLSTSWQAATRASGRFGDASWDRSQIVPVTTLKHAINEFGLPAFVKIDVEGFEYEVVSTLDLPVACLSVEFTSEYLESTFRCIKHFEEVSCNNSYQLTMGEDTEYYLHQWGTATEVLSALQGLHKDAWGDLYVKMGPRRTSIDNE